ncbi:MAG: phosphonopyruvate decarboxylase [Bacteriovorax sp.]|nr:phosphonopyruvate decarboxylase [Bacteriovorax sp.]
MISADKFLTPARELGFNFFTGTPCSYLKPFINYVIDTDGFDFIDSVNEGEAVAIAAGATIAGKRAVVMFQNSGLGNAVNPLTSLTYTFNLPIMVITTLRGEPGGAHDEPQHELMGQITIEMLETMRLKWAFFPREDSEVTDALKLADEYMKKTNQPFVFIMRKDDVSDWKLQKKPLVSKKSFSINHSDSFELDYKERTTRTPVLEVVQSELGSEVAVIATTGKTGRELYEVGDTKNQFYMVGSMGCALAFGLGIALTKPNLKVVVIDGDGALLMRTGTMATVGAYRPKNLLHILIDNEAHDSTGGQGTVTGGISFGAIARAFGYEQVYSTDLLETFKNILGEVKSNSASTFIHLKTQKGSPEKLGRPKVTPAEVSVRFAEFIQSK